ncbi:uncharacterized protein LOC101901300 [Musca domestica]|uniref:Uncharacterized protein LOC101901300 n=1 Tax=Musca domestica TaxID=7370 RepID=A0A9J7D4X0_MUSDO|nr:uncharacterized protein LOC101901300 [Musca domestica]
MYYSNWIPFFLLLLKCLSCQPLPYSGNVHDSDSAELDLIAAVEREEKLLGDEIEQIIRSTLPQLPAGQGYDADRELFRKFLNEAENLKSNRGDRLAKEFQYSKTFSNIVEKYREAGRSSSAEHQNVVKILKKNGFREFVNRLETFNKRKI